jgi:hypothetical protein
VTGGLIAYPIDDARNILRSYRDFTASLPDELVVFASLVHAPDGSGTPLLGFVPCHCGDLANGEKALKPIREFGTPVLDQIGTISYESMNTLLDAAFPKGALNYWKSSFLSNLSDEAIDTLLERFSNCPSPMSSLLLEQYHGAATRIGPTETAFVHRSPGYNLLVVSQWMDQEETDANVTWARDTFKVMKPHMGAGVYVNYLGDDDPASQVQAAFGPNFERLRSVKDRYDPENLFHLNQNIPPSA